MYLPLLADDGNGVLQFNVMEKALQENVSHSYQVVVLLCLIEGITWFTVSFVMLETRTKWKINKYIYIFKFPLQFLGSHRLLSSFLPVPVMVPHVHQLVLQLLDCPHLSPFTFPPHLDGWLAHYHSTLEKKKITRLDSGFVWMDVCITQVSPHAHVYYIIYVLLQRNSIHKRRASGCHLVYSIIKHTMMTTRVMLLFF